MFREPFSEPNPDTIKMRLIYSVKNLDGCANKDEVRDAILRIQMLEEENDALRTSLNEAHRQLDHWQTVAVRATS